MIDKIDLFKKLFPEEKIITINENQGAEHHILDINNKWICKISKNLDSSILEIEANLLKALHGKLKTKIPAIEYYEPNFIVYKKIPGIELTSEFYENLNSEQKNTLAYDIAFFLHELHNSLTIDEARKTGLKDTGWPWSPEQLIQKAYLIDNAELKEVFNTFIKDYSNLRKEPLIKLIHNDMIIRNIIINEQDYRLSGIIDFTDAAIDDFYIDLRLNYMSIPELSKSIAENYSKIANVTINIKKIYIYYIATEFSRYLQHIEEQKINDLDKIKERILSNLEYLN